MQPESLKKLDELELKINAIYTSVEKTRKYFMWTMIITIVLLVLPLLAAAFIVPSFISTYTSQFESLGL